MRRVCVTLLLLCAVTSGSAQADRIATYGLQLRTAGEYKLRLTAALRLSRSRDPRAVMAMADALRHDPETTVRKVAVLALGPMMDDWLPEEVRARAIAALQHASQWDESTSVRKHAALTLASLEGGGRRPSRGFVNIGIPVDQTRSIPRDAIPLIYAAIQRSLRKNAPEFSHSWLAQQLPSEAQLRRSETPAFLLASSVSELRVSKNGVSAEILCAVSLRVNPWRGGEQHERWAAEKSATATGTGRVVGTNSRAGIEGAARDCVVAVVEEVTSREIVPFLRRLRARSE